MSVPDPPVGGGPAADRSLGLDAPDGGSPGEPGAAPDQPLASEPIPGGLGAAPDRFLAPEPESDIADRLLYDAEIRAERAIAWLRLTVAALLAALIVVGVGIVETAARRTLDVSFTPSLVTTLGLAATSAAALALIRTGLYRPQLGWIFAFLDIALGLAALADGVDRYGLLGNEIFLLASAWIGPLMIAFNALRYRPAIIASAAAAYIAGGGLIAAFAGVALIAPAPRPDYARFADLPANGVRLALVALVGLCLALVVRRGRRLLLRALVEERGRVTLTRFLPSAVVADLTSDDSRLRSGAILDCTVLFVDMRGSTRITEHMDPGRVADFLTRFRRRITRVVAEHGGLIEKFTGDGALIVFGVPKPRPDDGGRALACARQLVAAIDEWNENRDPRSPLAIVVGVHAGRCFCGVVGDEMRLEFTVIGDAVNVAARLEALAKRRDEILIASRAALEQAGEPCGRRPWHALGATRLRGRSEAVEVFAYRPD